MLRKLKTELKYLWHSAQTIGLSKGSILAKKRQLFAKKADISKSKKPLVLKGIFFEITYECVLTCHILSF